jgi:hypothetical protein
VAAEIEQAVPDHALAHPCHGALRVEHELRRKGLQVSAGGIRGVWLRHDLLTKHQRLLRLEKATAERKLELTEEQVRLLERFSPQFRERQHRGGPHRRSAGGRHRPRRHAQGRRQGLPADHQRLPLALCPAEVC